MKATFPGISILGGKLDNIQGANVQLSNKQVLEINGLKITSYHTPCHTRGHMLYFFELAEGASEGQEHNVSVLAQGYQKTSNINRCVFTGDTVFTGGCGFFFEGKPKDMVAAMAVARDQIQ